MKRKPAPRDLASPPPKRRAPAAVTRALLLRFYPAVPTLRQYLLSRLPASSRRRRDLARLGLTHRPPNGSPPGTDLPRLLDGSFVGCSTAVAPTAQAELDSDFALSSQHGPASTPGSDVRPEYQAEIVDFVIRSLFGKHAGRHRPPHLLCHGFQRAPFADPHGPQTELAPAPSGLVPHHPNRHVEIIKGPAWSSLLVALGRGGDRIMIELLMHCAIFAPLDGPNGNCYQLSGKPLVDLEPLSMHRGPQNQHAEKELSTPAAVSAKPRGKGGHGLTAITFVRSRMLYARAALNSKGEVTSGLRHIHVLNRFPDPTSLKQTVHIMKYIFPRQFGLHNVFTSRTDYRETSHPFKDYTLREKEIAHDRLRKMARKGENGTKACECMDAIPKRLRGEAVDLVRRLRILHRRCSYVELLRHYCPVAARDSADPGVTRDEANHPTVDKVCFTDLATPEHQVSAVCRAMMNKVIPNGFWGEGEIMEHNKHVFMRHVDRFVCLRRYESLTLHEVSQDMKMANISWLRPANVRPGTNMSRTDFDKRRAIFLELIYYLFDSFLILFIRSNFHVTESNVDKNRIFYFRHHVWKMLSEPTFASLKTTMFEEMKPDKASKMLASRQLGYSQVRLLPKATGARPIMNLRRRVQTTANGKAVLGRSINSVMKPVFNVLNYERSVQPQRFGSSLFSVGDMFPRLKAFRSSLERHGLADKPLYFVKVDVRSCFDMIPQKRLLRLIKDLLSLDEYRVAKHAEVRAAGPYQYSEKVASAVKPVKRFVSRGRAADDECDFEQVLRTEMCAGTSNTVFVDLVVEQVKSKSAVLELLSEHVERNVIKMGKKFYRQKEGIPQGSVLSSLLCNFFYAELEAEVLGFLPSESSVLLRLIDDSLLITTEREHAERFLRIMYEGNADYGVGIKKEKTLVNFDVRVDGTVVPRSPSTSNFPYCGTLIDTGDLGVSKDFRPRERRRVRDGLTVEFSRAPGQRFHRKALNGLKMQLHGMFLDTSFNGVATAAANLHRCFLDAAQKCFEYMARLAWRGRRVDGLLIKTAKDMAALAAGRLRRTSSEVGRRHAQWLACRAFLSVFQRRQTRFAVLLRSLDAGLAAARPGGCAERAMLEAAARSGSRAAAGA